MDIKLIIDHLYLGDEYSSCSRLSLIERNIRYLVNAGYPNCKSHYEKEIQFYRYISFPFQSDLLHDDVKEMFDVCVEFIGMKTLINLLPQ